MQAARDAVSAMVDLLARRHGMRPVDAYMLCSVCADLRISELKWTGNKGPMPLFRAAVSGDFNGDLEARIAKFLEATWARSRA